MALALGLAVTLLRAAPDGAVPRVELHWEGRGCDESDRAARRIAELLPPEENAPRGLARVRLQPEEPSQSWHATIEIEIEASGTTITRTLRGGPCPSLADAIALVVAVTIDPLGASTRVDARASTTKPEATEAPPSAVRRPEPMPELTPAEEPADAAPLDLDPTASVAGPPLPREDMTLRSRPRSALPIAVSIIAEGGGALGLLPRIGGRVGGTFALELGAARISITGLHVVRRRVAHPDAPDAGADVALSGARLSGGWSFRTGRFTLPLCAGIEAGAFTADGFGLDQTTTARAAWVAIVPSLQPTVWATRWLGLGVHVEAPISLLRPRFGIDDFAGTDLVRIGSVGARFGLSVELRIPVRGDPVPAKKVDESRPVRRTAGSSG